MTETDLETWLTEAEAAARMRISVRTLRRRVAEGTGPEKRERPQPGNRPQAVYNPDDVARLAATPPAVFAPASPIAPREAYPAISVDHRISQNAVMQELATLLTARASAIRRPPARWLTVQGASETTGLSQTLIRRLIASGRLRAIRDGGFKVMESDLADLDAHACQNGTRAKGGAA